jgi:SPP1 gp7 family putative phage head morphogenesis protein
MSLLDWITKTQDKLNSLQKRIDSASLDELFKRDKKKHKSVTSKQKQIGSKSSRPVISAADQIMEQRDSFIRNGFKEYTFIANSDCCSVCGELNGKHYPVKKLQIGVNAPPMHEGCRCSIAAYSGRKEYEEWLNSL